MPAHRPGGATERGVVMLLKRSLSSHLCTDPLHLCHLSSASQPLSGWAFGAAPKSRAWESLPMSDRTSNRGALIDQRHPHFRGTASFCPSHCSSCLDSFQHTRVYLKLKRAGDARNGKSPGSPPSGPYGRTISVSREHYFVWKFIIAY